jgi:drug/metabolite transporter (DMT)-like permease
MKNEHKGIIIMIICTFFTAFGQFFQKKGTENLILTFPGIFTNYFLFLGLFLYGIGAFLLIIALRFGDLNVLYPIISLTFIWVTILSSFYLSESISTNKILGIGVILTGVVFINKGAKK